MATAASSGVKPKIEDGIQSTVMAIRESVMEYYKGTCIERLTDTNISRRGVHHNYHHLFERDNYALVDEQILRIGDTPIMNLKKNPDLTTLFGATLDRSKSFRAIRAGVETFFTKHLPNVALERSPEGSRSDWQRDRKLVLSNVPTGNHVAEDDLYEYVSGQASDALNITPPHRDAPEGETFQLSNGDIYVRRNGEWYLRRLRPQVAQWFTTNSPYTAITEVLNNVDF